MIKLIGPGLSTEASGKLADAIVFSHSAKRAYAKAHAAPKNPKTPGQLGVRANMKFLAQIWQTLTPAQQASWEDPANLAGVYPYHAFISVNAFRWSTYRTPSKEHPATETTTPGNITNWQALPKVAHAYLRVMTIATPHPWGFIFYRAPATGFTPDRSNAIGFIEKIPGTPNIYLDTPLLPGTYYYRVTSFHETGLAGPMSTEKSVTIT